MGLIALVVIICAPSWSDDGERLHLDGNILQCLQSFLRRLCSLGDVNNSKMWNRCMQSMGMTELFGTIKQMMLFLYVLSLERLLTSSAQIIKKGLQEKW